MANRIVISGRLTEDPSSYLVGEEKTPLTKLRIANHIYLGADKEKTSFFSVAAWRKLAGLCEKNLTKGNFVLVDGRIEEDKYIDKNGVERRQYIIVADSVEFLETRNSKKEKTPVKTETDTNTAPSIPTETSTEASKEEDDDVPF